jgi:hypothetical protein
MKTTLAQLFICNSIYEDNNSKYRKRYVNNFVGPDIDYVAKHTGIEVKDEKLYLRGKIDAVTYHSLKSLIYRSIGDKVSMIAGEKETFLDFEGVELTILDIDPTLNKLKMKIENFDKWQENGKFRLLISETYSLDITCEIFEMYIGQVLTCEIQTDVSQTLRCLEITEE